MMMKGEKTAEKAVCNVCHKAFGNKKVDKMK